MFFFSSKNEDRPAWLWEWLRWPRSQWPKVEWGMPCVVTSWHWESRFSGTIAGGVKFFIVKVSVEGISKRIGIKVGEIYAFKNGRIWWLGRNLVVRI